MPVDNSADLTITGGLNSETSALTQDMKSTNLPNSGEARFIAGDLVADRYRIEGLLGRGGMGEVYRAEDLKLGQSVALKFLPPGLEQDPSRLHRFLNEVKTARQVTHPNVCRVFDIGDYQGQHFLSMEYVDGEDLSTSLRRFGRLPEERAVEVSRQICAGLAAAHAQGILHRDLKPANVMIDGQGQVKLTDFGLAGLATSIGQDDVRVGTPAYMSPEQITGQEVTVRSDIYALGLVLYEIFTGQHPFQADTLAEYEQLHTASIPSQPSSVLQGLDPVVERAIVRCLEKKPAGRPGSALAVAAALPGGDPLQAALEAGETPSPELVAEAGHREGMSPGRALLMAGLAMLIIGGASLWAGRMGVLNFAPLDKQPEVLMDKVSDMVGSLGYDEEAYTKPVDKAFGFLIWNDIINEVSLADSSAGRWDNLRQRPDAMGFWYRQSPRVLTPNPDGGPVLARGPVTLTNPMATSAGEMLVVLDLDGRLRRFEVMPKRYSTREASEPNWAKLFTLADLDTSRFQEVAPRYQRFMAPDLRRAWLGTRKHQPEVEIRVEAGAFEGRPVLFNVTTAQSLLSLGKDPEPNTVDAAFWVQNSLQPILILLVVIFAIRASANNAERKRSDIRGAFRFGTLAFILFFLSRCLESHSLFTRNWAGEIWPIIVGAVFIGFASWGLYTAAEPMGRRIWPTMFISSSRLLSRPQVQWRDPLIGLSVLVGLLAAGIDFILRGPVNWNLAAKITNSPPILSYIDLSLLQGQRQVLSLILDQGLMMSFLLVHVMVLVFLHYLVKKRTLALGITLVVWTLLTGPGNYVAAGLGLMSSAIYLFVLLRWGIVAMVVGRVVNVLVWSARPVDLTSWYSENSVIILVAIALLAVYGVWAAVGKPYPSSNGQRVEY